MYIYIRTLKTQISAWAIIDKIGAWNPTIIWARSLFLPNYEKKHGYYLPFTVCTYLSKYLSLFILLTDRQINSKLFHY